MNDFSERTEQLLGAEAVRRLEKARVAVFGLGGVGGAAVEVLARSGVGALDLIDKDCFELSNLNRQLLSSRETLGRLKTEAARKRVLSINPDCRVTLYPIFYLPETADAIDFSLFDYVIDAVDTVTAKLLIIEKAAAAGVPVISSMGTGNKLDPTAFRTADIYETSVDPLAKIMRRECKKRGIKALKVVYSEEEPRTAPQPAAGERPPVGSAPFVPPVAGMILAAEAVKELCGIRLPG